MALESTLQGLCAELDGLVESLDSLLITIREDGPRLEELALIDHLADPTEDLAQRFREISAVARLSRKAAHPFDADGVRRGLIECHQRSLALAVVFSSTLGSFDRITEVTALFSRRTAGVAGWARIVRQSVESIQRRFFSLAECLLRCWEDFTERMGTTSVSVHTTNIGQKL